MFEKIWFRTISCIGLYYVMQWLVEIFEPLEPYVFLHTLVGSVISIAYLCYCGYMSWLIYDDIRFDIKFRSKRLHLKIEEVSIIEKP